MSTAIPSRSQRSVSVTWDDDSQIRIFCEYVCRAVFSLLSCELLQYNIQIDLVITDDGIRWVWNKPWCGFRLKTRCDMILTLGPSSEFTSSLPWSLSATTASRAPSRFTRCFWSCSKCRSLNLEKNQQKKTGTWTYLKAAGCRRIKKNHNLQNRFSEKILQSLIAKFFF